MHEDEFYLDCEWCGERFVGEDAIRSYLRVVGPDNHDELACLGCLETRCEVCKEKTENRCTNKRCSRCHEEWCTPGGTTYPGHGRKWPEPQEN